ncbi:MAG: ribonuclease Z [Bacteroidales bacterium]
MKFELTILGSSSALPTSQRNLTAHMLNVYERFFLIDCGEGTQIQLRKNKLRFNRVNHIFISHNHGDHFYGLFGLLSSFNLLKRTNDLHIYAHKELRKGIKYIIRNYESHVNYKIIFHELNTEYKEKIFEDDKVEVYSFPLSHKIPTSGFLFKEQQRLPNIKKDYVKKYNIPIKKIKNIKEGADFIKSNGTIIPHTELTLPPYKARSYAYCTDTSYDRSIIPIIRNVDLLYHEATFAEYHANQAEKTFHSTAKQAATIAKDAGVKTLIIGHFSARYKQVEQHLSEAKSIFDNTHAAHDGLKKQITPVRISRNKTK